MNRRKAVQSLLALTAAGISSVSVYEWLTWNKDAVPVHDLPQKKQLIAELAETIIPRTDTPGAKDAKVEDYIIKMISQNTDPKMQRNFLAGLGSLEKYTYDTYHKPFAHCSAAQKNAILTHYEDKATYAINILNKVNNKFLGPPFFTQLKNLTVEGYCTSQEGCTQGMAYIQVPVVFEPCIPLTPNQKAWATK